MYKFIYYVLFIPVFIYGLYFLITSIPAFKKNRVIVKRHKANKKLAILIPARNEANVIKDLITSLKNQNYPKNLYDIYVIPNNCTDNTLDICIKEKVNIISCDIEIKGKGDVLKFVLSKLSKEKDYDGYVIFDADNVVHPMFLKRMNDVLIEGYDLAQGFRDSKNPSDNWICGSYSLYYWGQNIFFNKSRMNMNLSCSINGTGFMISDNYIKKYPFNTVTMTEDMELTAQAALNNKKIAYVSDAITYDEQPLSFTSSVKQRMRWTTGTYQCLFAYGKKLFLNFIKTKNISCLDMLLFFLAPFIQLIGSLVFLLLFIYSILGIKLYDIFSYLFAFNELFFIISYLISIILSTLVVILSKKNVNKILIGILLFPVFLISWIPINLICLFRKNINWEPIIHTRNVNLESLIDD